MAPAFVNSLLLSGTAARVAPSLSSVPKTCSGAIASTSAAAHKSFSFSKAPVSRFSFCDSLVSRKFSISFQGSKCPSRAQFTIRAEEEDVNVRIEQLVKDNKIMIFIKGSKIMPQCGFSNTVVQIMNRVGVPFETYDVLSDAEIRQGIKEYSSWPTIPQVYINGEFVGGCDILIDLYQNGELEQMLEVALGS